MTGLMNVDNALKAIAAQALDPGHEELSLSEALGRRLASDIIARVAAPPVNMSAMDGYAVRFIDVSVSGAKLKIVGDVPAGSPTPPPLGRGEAMRVFTGAPMPAGADHVLIQEDAAREGDLLTAARPQTIAQHVREAGRDFAAGDILLRAGQVLGPAEIGLAAAGNHGRILVSARPKVAVLSAGNELRRPGGSLAPGQIVDSNTPALWALIELWGGELIDAPIAQDTLASINAAISAVQAADIVVAVGGASVGDFDLMKPAFHAAGADVVFAGVAVRPGKPTWFARLGAQRVLGLPGNPASAYVCAHLFLKPLLEGEFKPAAFFEARLAAPVKAEGNREAYLRADCTADTDGLSVHVFPDQDSSLFRPLQAANCLVRRMPGASAADVGEIVQCLALTQASVFRGSRAV